MRPAEVPAETGGPAPRRRVAAGVGLLALGCVPATVMAVLTSSVSIPHNDDWAYLRTANTLLHTGHFRLVGQAGMSLVGQAVAVQPFLSLGGVAGANVFGIVASMASVIAAYWVACPLLRGHGGWWVAATLAACPLLTLLTATFMTDLPALTAELISLGLGLRALAARGRRRAWLLVGTALAGLVGISIREQTLAAVAGVVAGLSAQALRRRDRRAICDLLGLGLGYLLPAAALLLWRRDQPHGGSYGVFSTANVQRLGTEAWVSLGLLLLPVLLLGSRVKAPWPWRLLGAAGGAAAAESIFLHNEIHLVGNYVEPVTPSLSAVIFGAGQSSLPLPLWHAIAYLGGVASIGLGVRVVDAVAAALLMVRRRRVPAEVVALTATATVSLLLVGATLFTGSVFDRYLIPLLIPVGILLTRNRSDARGQQAPAGRRRLTWAVRVAVPATGLAALAALGWALTLESDVFDRARWDAGQSIVADGVPAQQIDAGLEWVGYHTDRDVNGGAPLGPGLVVESVWEGYFNIGPCWLVADGPFPLPSLLQKAPFTYTDWLGHRRSLSVSVQRSAVCSRWNR